MKEILYRNIVLKILSGILCIGTLHNYSTFAAGTMRNMTSMQIVYDMKAGWNLGNTLDAWTDTATGLNTETCWGNPKTTKKMIDAVYAKGFKTLRLPVTWKAHFGNSPDYIIDKAWIDRVEEIVNYALDNGMYVILNSHHDEWVTLTASTQTEVTAKITKIWAQISERFKDYSDFLIFETLNEPRLYGTTYEWSGGTAEARKILNAYNLAIVNTIRNSGGNNALRHIMIPTHAATSMEIAQNDLVIPDNDSRIIISQHTYWPYNFTMNTGAGATTKWGSASDKSACDVELDRIKAVFVDKGIPVVIGEWGSIERSNTQDRAVHAEYYAGAVRKRGMCPVWWDNGYEKSEGFALLSRSTCNWVFPSIADGLIKGVNDNTPVIQQAARDVNSGDFEISSGVVRYSLKGASDVSLSVYNMQGRAVLNIVKAYQAAGSHNTKLPVNRIAPGNYFLQLKYDNSLFTKKIFSTK